MTHTPSVRGKSGLLNAADMTLWLKAHCSDFAEKLKVILVGQCGAGKSHAGNALYGGDVFESRYQPGSVTSGPQFAAIIFDNTCYVICDVPGLVDANEQNRARNAAAIQGAVEFEPAIPSLVLFILEPKGGRACLEHISIFKQLNNYAMFRVDAVQLVVNKIDWEELVGQEEEYTAAFTNYVRELVGMDISATFLSHIPKKERADFSSTVMKRLQLQLLRTVASMKPMVFATGRRRITELSDENEKLRQKLAAATHRIEKLEKGGCVMQ